MIPDCGPLVLWYLVVVYFTLAVVRVVWELVDRLTPDLVPLVEPRVVTPAAEPVDDQVAEVLGAVTEAAAHRFPGHHPSEALERYVLDLRGANCWHRDEAKRKAAAEAVAATATVEFDATELFQEIERHG